MSESQERMCAVVEPEKVDRFLEICEKWDVIATVIGEVTDGDRLEIYWHGGKIVDVDPRTVAHDGPVYERPYARPAWQDALQADDANKLPRPATSEELKRPGPEAGRLPEPGLQVLDHLPVRPLRAGQHGARPARGLRA